MSPIVYTPLEQAILALQQDSDLCPQGFKGIFEAIASIYEKNFDPNPFVNLPLRAVVKELRILLRNHFTLYREL